MVQTWILEAHFQDYHTVDAVHVLSLYAWCPLLLHFRNHALHPFLVPEAIPQQSPPGPMRLSDHRMIFLRTIVNFHSEILLPERIRGIVLSSSRQDLVLEIAIREEVVAIMGIHFVQSGEGVVGETVGVAGG